MRPAAACAVAAALGALCACGAQPLPSQPLMQPGSGLYTPGDASELCSYSYAPNAEGGGGAALTWRLNRGAGAYSLGLMHPKGFYRVDVGAGEKATSFFFQFCGSMAFTPASPPPACVESGVDACPAACGAAPGRVCGNGCASLVSAPPGAAVGRCHALARAAGNVTVAPLNASRPGDGLAFTFAAGDAVGCGAGSTGRTLRVAVRCASGGPLAPALLPASVSPVAGDESGCAWETALSHPAGCPERAPGAAPSDAPPVLYWEKERRYVERHVGADEVYEHFALLLRNDGGGSLLASLFALQNANFIRFNPPALTLGPGEAGVVDVKVPSRFVYDGAEVKIQTNGGEGSFFLIRDDWPSARHPELAPRSKRHTQLAALAALAAVFALCSAAGRGGARRARAARAEAAQLQLGRHRQLADPEEDELLRRTAAGDASDDEGEGGLTGRRCAHYRRRFDAAAAAAAADDDDDAEMAAACAASEAAGGGNDEDDVAWRLRIEERAAAKAASLAAEMGAERFDSDDVTTGRRAADDAANADALLSPPSPSQADGLAAAERQLLCVVCLAAPKCVALIPCRHLSTCLECTRRLTAAATPRCPLCRRPATDFVQLFL